MGVIINRITLVGSKGEKKVDGLFDSGASFSFIMEDLASRLGNIVRLPAPLEFETAKEGEKVTVKVIINNFLTRFCSAWIGKSKPYSLDLPIQ